MINRVVTALNISASCLNGEGYIKLPNNSSQTDLNSINCAVGISRNKDRSVEFWMPRIAQAVFFFLGLYPYLIANDVFLSLTG